MRMPSPSISGALAHVHCSHYAEGLHFSAFHNNADMNEEILIIHIPLPIYRVYRDNFG